MSNWDLIQPNTDADVLLTHYFCFNLAIAKSRQAESDVLFPILMFLEIITRNFSFVVCISSIQTFPDIDMDFQSNAQYQNPSGYFSKIPLFFQFGSIALI